MHIPRRVENTFWNFTAIGEENECWNWQRCTDSDGYGRVACRENGKRINFKTHIVSWVLATGIDPNGMCVLHTCDNRRCVNPSHLWLGTSSDNHKDCELKKRHPHGESNGRAVLTEQDVIALRELRKKGLLNINDAAKRYGVTKSVISHAVTGRCWGHLPGAIR